MFINKDACFELGLNNNEIAPRAHFILKVVTRSEAEVAYAAVSQYSAKHTI